MSTLDYTVNEFGDVLISGGPKKAPTSNQNGSVIQPLGYQVISLENPTKYVWAYSASCKLWFMGRLMHKQVYGGGYSDYLVDSESFSRYTLKLYSASRRHLYVRHFVSCENEIPETGEKYL